MPSTKALPVNVRAARAIELIVWVVVVVLGSVCLAAAGLLVFVFQDAGYYGTVGAGEYLLVGALAALGCGVIFGGTWLLSRMGRRRSSVADTRDARPRR